MPDRMNSYKVTQFLEDRSGLDRWARDIGLSDGENASQVFKRLVSQDVDVDLLGLLIKILERILPLYGEADRLLVSLDRFLQAVESPLSTIALFEHEPEALEALLAILATSPFLGEIVIAEPDVWERIRSGGGRPEKRESLRDILRSEVGDSLDSAFVMQVLRRFKRREILRVAYGDIVKHQRLETVVDQISAIADCIIDEALRVALLQQQQRRGSPITGDGRPATITVIALGKLGGNELNYSSDIDLVFCYSEDGDIAGSKTYTTSEFFERVVQQVTRLIADQTELGAVYRVDLRLRPYGGQGPLVLPRVAVERYYDRQGRTWERQAWVKARCVAGDLQLGEDLLANLRPWVYSRWLPRTEISGIRALKRQIERRSIREGVDSADLKTGRGGIRDIEFTIQKGKLYLLQTRNGKRTAEAAIKIAVDMVNENKIDINEALLRVDPESLNQLLHPALDKSVEADFLLKGMPASPGAVSGKIVLESEEAVKLSAAGESVILIRLETSPEDISGMHAASGILTSRGGMTSHAAVVARGMGRACITGANELRIDFIKNGWDEGLHRIEMEIDRSKH